LIEPEGTIDTGAARVRMRAMGSGIGLGVGGGVVGSSARTATAVILLSAAACGSGADQPAGLVQLAPQEANNDIPLSAVIFGTSFRPTYHFDAVSGNAGVDVNGFTALLSPDALSAGTNVAVPLSDVVWEAESMLRAVVPAGIAVGTYDLVVRDPRGQSSKLLGAFQSLGPDLTPPVVTIVDPAADSIIGAQAQVGVVVQVDDGTGQVVSLAVNVRTDTASFPPQDCSAAAQAKTACVFSFVAPTPSSSAAVLFIDATAVDGGGNTGTAETVLELVPAPLATSLSPSRGSSLGSTAVTLTGANFLDGPTVVMFGGIPAAVSGWSPTSMTIETPPHVAGVVDVSVNIGGAVATLVGGFVYVDPPLARAISPSYGPTAGGTAVKVVGDNFDLTTQIFVGGSALVGSHLDNQNLIEGFTPPGTGEALLSAYDPILDSTTSGTAAFDYGADGGLPVGGFADASLTIPYPLDGGSPGSGP
jgi:hypothetical protein